MRFLIIGVVIAVIFWVISIVDCAVQPPNRHRGVAKGGWLAIVILLPVIGGILWFAVGRVSKFSPLAPVAPDDNPEFLSTLGSVSDQNERIRRLEEELAALDSESDSAPRASAAPSVPDDASSLFDEPKSPGDDPSEPGEDTTPRGSAGTAN